MPLTKQTYKQPHPCTCNCQGSHVTVCAIPWLVHFIAVFNLRILYPLPTCASCIDPIIFQLVSFSSTSDLCIISTRCNLCCFGYLCVFSIHSTCIYFWHKSHLCAFPFLLVWDFTYLVRETRHYLLDTISAIRSYTWIPDVISNSYHRTCCWEMQARVLQNYRGLVAQQ